MARLQHRRLDRPDEVRAYAGGRTEVFELSDFVIGRMIMEPGWRWDVNVKPIAGTNRCENHHMGYVISGRLHVEMLDGTEALIGPGELFEIPPGHLADVVGDEAWETIEFRGARTYARAPVASGDRVLATILFTDIVESTSRLREMGDASWGALLAEHNQLMQVELDRYRGREVKKTGDGLIAIFDGPARAVECAASMVRQSADVGLVIRAGLHTGEIEHVGDDIQGVAVHFAARIMALAGPGEVLISSVTQDLLAGSGHTFESRGSHVLKGIDGEREVFALQL